MLCVLLWFGCRSGFLFGLVTPVLGFIVLCVCCICLLCCLLWCCVRLLLLVALLCDLIGVVYVLLFWVWYAVCCVVF